MARKTVSKTPFGQRLTQVREALGFKERATFALMLLMNPETLGGYERGDSAPDLQFLEMYKQRFSVNLNWLFSGDGEMFNGASSTLARSPAYQIDKEVFKQVGRLVLQLHKEEGIRLPPDAVLEAQSNAYNDLLARAEDPADNAELMSLLPWLETRLRKALKAAVSEPGTGKRLA